MRRGTNTRLGGVVAVALLAACAFAPKLATPRLSVAEVQVVGGDLWEQHLRVRVHVENPNDRALPVSGLEYTLEVEGERFASGQSAASFTVPALGTADFDMNVTTNLAGTLIKLLGRGADARAAPVQYRLVGKVSLSAGLMRAIPFESQGSFSLQ
ncbi:MAG: LEA type 2 family protein [Gammaproteobacteria bacterium]|nr:LEA type 2 family protein [Gammaproteobacteria bacterium]